MMDNASIENQTAQFPTRQGFYWARTAGGRVIAQFKRLKNPTTKTLEPTWLQYVSDDPTIEKQPTPLKGVISYEKASRDDIDKALARELTVAEQADAAYARFIKQQELYGGYARLPIPESRRLAVGDEVGSSDGKVVALYDDGQVVAIRTRKATRDAPAKAFVEVWHWTGVLKRADCLDGRQRLVRDTPVTVNFSNRTIDSLLHMRIRSNACDSPEYQRGYVWTYEDKQRFLASVFAQRDIGKFVFVRRRFPLVDQVLDGKQRLSTLIDFYTSQLDFQGKYWHELSWRDRASIESTIVPVATLEEERVGRAFILETFLEINAAGVPQAEEHLAAVRALLAAEQAKEQRATKRRETED